MGWGRKRKIPEGADLPTEAEPVEAARPESPHPRILEIDERAAAKYPRQEHGKCFTCGFYGQAQAGVVHFPLMPKPPQTLLALLSKKSTGGVGAGGDFRSSTRFSKPRLPHAGGRFTGRVHQGC